MSRNSFQIYNVDALKYRYNGQEYVVQFFPDEYVSETPRDWENCGAKMISFHPDYRIGDEHDYKNSEEFWTDMVDQFVPRETILQHLKDGNLGGIRLERNPEHNEYYAVYESGFWAKQDEWYLQYDKVAECDLASRIIGDISERDCMMLCVPYMEALPLWLYDHSGISISCGKRVGQFADRWDSSGIGWIYISKEDAISKLNANEDDWRSVANEDLKRQVEMYDMYLRGDVWGYCLYVLNEDGELEEEDSCYGFYGSDLYENGMLPYIPGLEEALENDQVEEGHLNTVYTGVRYVFE